MLGFGETRPLTPFTAVKPVGAWLVSSILVSGEGVDSDSLEAMPACASLYVVEVRRGLEVSDSACGDDCNFFEARKASIAANKFCPGNTRNFKHLVFRVAVLASCTASSCVLTVSKMRRPGNVGTIEVWERKSRRGR